MRIKEIPEGLGYVKVGEVVIGYVSAVQDYAFDIKTGIATLVGEIGSTPQKYWVVYVLPQPFLTAYLAMVARAE